MYMNDAVMGKIEFSLTSADLISHTDDLEKFKDSYSSIEAVLSSGADGTADKALLVAALTSKYKAGNKDMPLRELMNVIYNDPRRAAFESGLCILSSEKDSPAGAYEDLLQYADSDEDKLNVLSTILNTYLYQYNEGKITETAARIKEIMG